MGLIHVLAILQPEKSQWFILNSRLVGPQTWYGHFGEKKNLAFVGN